MTRIFRLWPQMTSTWLFAIIIITLSHFFSSKEVDDPAHTEEEEDQMFVAFTFLSFTFFSYAPTV